MPEQSGACGVRARTFTVPHGGNLLVHRVDGHRPMPPRDAVVIVSVGSFQLSCLTRACSRHATLCSPSSVNTEETQVINRWEINDFLRRPYQLYYFYYSLYVRPYSFLTLLYSRAGKSAWPAPSASGPSGGRGGAGGGSPGDVRGSPGFARASCPSAILKVK